jgi:hypothetical protein
MLANLTGIRKFSSVIYKPRAHVIEIDEQTPVSVCPPALFSTSTPSAAGKRKKVVKKTQTPMVDRSVRRSTRSMAKNDGFRHSALPDTRQSTRKRRKIQRKALQQDILGGIEKDPEDTICDDQQQVFPTKNGTAGTEHDQEKECNIPVTPIKVMQKVGLALGIDAAELVKEKLMADPDETTTSQSNDK